ncbi:MAG: ABC transporter ATP-binding protein [Kiritimatiellae bacterium]|nr:ABC transporter ATP-binding protein [Kiritimatiellia bacterium]MDW8458276.1 ABC transporter ATP-binding protein [Verrucomicrobiota bacterium]
MSAPLLEVRGLTTWYPIRRGVWSRTVGFIQALTDVDLVIREGETLAVVGESGCGKTTLGRTIAGLEIPRAGEMFWRGTPLPAGIREPVLQRKIQMVFQDPAASLNPRLPIVDLLTEALAHHGLLETSREETARKLLEDVGMDASALHRYPFEFSGGQRQRISIARALALKPELVICDEPVSALDVSVQAQVLNLLIDLRERYRLSYLFITHDINVVRFLADRIAVMYLGRIVEEGPAEAVLEQPAHPYTRSLISAVPVPGRERRERLALRGETPSPANPPGGCAFHPRCPLAMDRCPRERPVLSVVSRMPQKVSCHLYGGALSSAQEN